MSVSESIRCPNFETADNARAVAPSAMSRIIATIISHAARRASPSAEAISALKPSASAVMVMELGRARVSARRDGLARFRCDCLDVFRGGPAFTDDAFAYFLFEEQGEAGFPCAHALSRGRLNRGVQRKQKINP